MRGAEEVRREGGGEAGIMATIKAGGDGRSRTAEGGGGRADGLVFLDRPTTIKRWKSTTGSQRASKTLTSPLHLHPTRRSIFSSYGVRVALPSWYRTNRTSSTEARSIRECLSQQKQGRSDPSRGWKW